MWYRSDKGVSADDAIRAFQEQLARQEDVIYGAALMFECVALLHSNQAALVETHRKQFRNIIQKSREQYDKAAELLAEVKKKPERAAELGAFVFTPCEGHPNPPEMARRVAILVDTYRRIFPDRPRSREFTREETLRLIEGSALSLS
jgi:hypothetical protein